jgi:hypothetical protein
MQLWESSRQKVDAEIAYPKPFTRTRTCISRMGISASCSHRVQDPCGESLDACTDDFCMGICPHRGFCISVDPGGKR